MLLQPGQYDKMYESGARLNMDRCKEKELQKLREEFVTASIAKKTALYKEANVRKTNRNHDRMIAIQKKLAPDKQKYKEFFLPQLKHENYRVRLDAACAFRAVGPSAAKAVLDEIVAHGDRFDSTEACTVLHFWRSDNSIFIRNLFAYEYKDLPVRYGINAEGSKEKTVTLLREKFVDAAIAYEYHLFGAEGWKPDEASRSYDIMIAIRQVLKVAKQSYRELFLPLLEHENDFVKKEAAYSLLPLETEKAEKALEEVIDSGTKETGDSARKTRKLWKQGQFDELNSLFADDLLQS